MNLASKSPRRVAVIGGGIAGCTAATMLARRGVDVTLFEAENIAAGASGNRYGILYPRIERGWNAVTRFYVSALFFAERLYAMHTADTPLHQKPALGMLRFGKDAEASRRLCETPDILGLPETFARAVDAKEASLLAGTAITQPGLYVPQARIVRPQAICQALATSIERCVQARVTALTSQEEQWHIQCQNGETFGVDRVILATAYDAIVDTLVPLPIERVRGQVSAIPATSSSEALRTILCAGGYLLPQIDGYHYCGATYDYHRTDVALDPASHQRNAGSFAALAPELAFPALSENWDGRVAFRAVTPDRLPIVGEIAPGCYATLAHGSRGLISAPIAAEILASMLLGEPCPVDREIITMLLPQRFQTRPVAGRPPLPVS